MKHIRAKRARILALAALLAAAVAVPALVVADGGDPELEIERYTLDNGLEVILHQDNSVPLVAVDVWYHVGAGDETPGRSGFAHLFEHMLFQGSKHVGEDKHFETLKSIGASSVNGTTSTDRTNYFEVVPSHQLETALWLESDRMGYFLPMLTEKSFRNQVDVVRNERRQSYDNRPYGTTILEIFEKMFAPGHPYKYLVIGRHADLEAATLEDVTDFYKRWYVPANATLAIAGDFDRAEVKELINRWFGSFPRSERPKHREVEFPNLAHAEQKRTIIEDGFAPLRMLTYAWHTPKFFDDGDAEMDILANTLGASGTGRLYKRLVHEEGLAQVASAAQYSMGHSSLFLIQVMLMSDADQAKVERIIEEEMNKVLAEPISKEEFSRAVTDVESNYIWGLESLLQRAERMQTYNHYVGQPDYITQDLDRYRKSSPEKVQQLARQYLIKDKRLEFVTTPAKKAAGKPDAAGKGVR
jgi:zinc protease